MGHDKTPSSFILRVAGMAIILFHRQVLSIGKRPLMIAVASWVPVALAQANLGAVLDAGGRHLSADEFKRNVVDKVMRGVDKTQAGMTGASAGRNSLELIYLSAGGIRGTGQAGPLGGATGGGQSFEVEGSWTIDERGRICTSMRMGRVVLAPRCQFWYVLDKQYFVSDSDSDRSARTSEYMTP
jgi:hypothetical protein